MTLGHGPKIVRDGLVFAYDMEWNDRFISKSYKGKPTINYAWDTNPRIDSSYTQYVHNTNGTWPQKHWDAITVYNKAGTNITQYVNTGVTDYTNTYHATWIYDSELKRPVVIMRNWDGGQWKAKYFNLGKTYTDMGLTNGDTYTISWLQWTDNIGRSALAGVYGTNTSGVNGFHDGQSHAKGAFNTKVCTWERLYATFTVAATNNLTTTRSCYMYGQYNGSGVIKIADVQIETGGPSGYIAEDSEANSTRSSTTALLDWTGNNNITVNNLTYNSDGSFSFNGSNSYLSIPDSVNTRFSHTTPWSIQMVYKVNSFANTYPGLIIKGGANASGVIIFYQSNGSVYWKHNNSQSLIASHSNGEYVVLCVTFDGTTVRGYKNGVFTNTAGSMVSTDTSNSFMIGRADNYGNQDIYSFSKYNKALSASEVLQNFNAHRGRYGL